MPERDENAVFNETFESIIDVNQVRDIGINSFEDNLREVREHLVYKFIENAEPIDDAYVKRLAALIDSEWTHEGDIAKVSGRVYLDNEDYEEEVSRHLGEAEVDDSTGDIYYLVYEARLRSYGIQINPIYNDGDLVDFRTAYTFSIEDDGENTPLIFAYHDELSRHDYEKPTPQQAAIRLQHEWPKQFQRIEKLILPDGHTNLPRRLTKLARDLQKDLTKSVEFRELVQIYVDHYLGLDRKLPYIVLIQGEFSYFDGNDPDEPKETEEWNDVVAVEPMTVMAYAPCFRFMQNIEGKIESAFYMGTYNTEDGDEEEYICVGTENIQQFRSTRALRSIMSKAIEKRDGELERFIIANTPSENITPQDIDSAEDGADISFKQYEFHKPDLDVIASLKQVELGMQKISQIVKAARKRIYGSDDEASAAAAYLVTSEIQPIFEALYLTQPVVITASGEGVRVFGRKIGLDKTDERVLLSVELGSSKPIASIPAGDSKSGLLSTVMPLLETVSGEDDSIVGYRASASLVLTVEPQVQSLFQLNGINIADITVNQKIVAALDGTAEIKLPLLENYRDIQLSLGRFTERYGKVPLVQTIQKLRDVIFNEQVPDGSIDLKNLKPIKRMGQRLNEQIENGRDVSGILEALETLFVESRVELRGVTFKRGSEGFEETSSEKTAQEVSSQIIDVRADVFEGDLAFVMKDPRYGVVYVPFNSVEQFSF